MVLTSAGNRPNVIPNPNSINGLAIYHIKFQYFLVPFQMNKTVSKVVPKTMLITIINYRSHFLCHISIQNSSCFMTVL